MANLGSESLVILTSEDGRLLTTQPVVSTSTAIGSQIDVQNRINALLPTGWFTKGLVPIRDALVAGLAYLGSQIYSLIVYLRLQTRISTATDGFLELIALDYSGLNGLLRRGSQSDSSYRANILASILRPRNTRAAISAILLQLTGVAPIIFEPWRPADTGDYNDPATLAYNTVGGYGSMNDPGQAFITAFLPPGNGVPAVAGYGIPVGAYSTPSLIEYASLALIAGSITLDDIYVAVNSVRPATRLLWVRLGLAAAPFSIGDIATETDVVIDTEAGTGLAPDLTPDLTTETTGISIDTESGSSLEF